jgi:alkylhydroperoxidase family enzyme
MTSSAPRIAPVLPSAFSPEQAALAQPGSGREALNIVRTMVNHPTLYAKWMPFAEELVFRSTIPLREREILILKTIAICRGTYPIAQHNHVARNIGLTEAEIAAARSDGAGLSSFEQALVRAADELLRDHTMSDATWAALAERYAKTELMEVVFLVGNYAITAMATNTFGVQVEDGAGDLWKPFHAEGAG